jgi:hypothetical protein
MVVKFTLQLEDRTSRFYEDVARSGKLILARELFVKLAESSKKRRRELEKAARESVDHSLLEPISGFTDEAYPVGIVFSLEMGDHDILGAARQLEEGAQKFYIDATNKIKFIAGVSRLFERYAQSRAKALDDLRSLS